MHIIFMQLTDIILLEEKYITELSSMNKLKNE